MMCIKIDIESQDRKYNKMQMSLCVNVPNLSNSDFRRRMRRKVIFKFSAHLMSGYLHFNRTKNNH